MKTSLYSLRSLAFCCASSSLLLAALDVQAAISQSPLSLTVGVPPNLILTLDDSGSMDRAYIPDDISGGTSTRRYKSAYYNPMYYNPATTYQIPPRFNLDGTQAADLSTSFTAAWLNGFKTSKGSVNLSNSYRPASGYDTNATSQSNASNPTPEFYLSETYNRNISNGNSSELINANSISFRINRITNSSCTVTVEKPQNYPPINCNRSGADYTLSINDKRTSNVQAYYYVYDDTLSNCPTNINSRKADDNCYRKVDVSSSSGQIRPTDTASGTDERANFAIWYSFYRTRSLATVSAASIAFADLASSTRITWQALNTCSELNTSSSCLNKDNRFREYNSAQRGRLFDWMQSMTFNNGTPLRLALDKAGKFLKNNNSPAWDKYPNETGNTAKNKYACRPSYHILMTDGVWNGSDGSPSDRKSDTSDFNLPDGVNYTGQRRPYTDAANNTLADLAFHYWATDLNSDLANNLKPYYKDKSGTNTDKYWNPQNNPATWQNMANFTIGLGLTASLNQAGLTWNSTDGTFASPGYVNISNGTQNWPKAESNSDNNVYDLWHAAINSRGDFFSADSPESVVQAFADIMSRIADRKSTAAKPAINSGQVVVDENDPNNSKLVTSSYQTSYASDENWLGNLVRTNKEWTELPAGSGKFELALKEKWSAKDKMPAADARNIKIKSTGSGGLQPFTWANAGNKDTSGTLANLLSKDPENGNTSDSKGEARLNYLRGVRTGEGATFRSRSGILGDLLASSPAVVSGGRYLVGVANRLEGNDSYTIFKESQATRRARVYVGGNDGMLHGFNADTGVEEFAFIPSAVFPKLNKLTGKNYSHEFYVDGSPVVADIYDGSKWRTILVGTLRAGGKSIFALDITTPGSEKLLWEFDDSKIVTPNTVKMGYSFSQPTIARLHNGRWAVVFGNGYEASNHTNGKAALFIVDAIEGTLERSLEVTGTNGIANGLSTPRLADNNGDSVADYAYAGDLQGNLWRFDLLPSTRDADNPLARSATETRGSVSQYQVAYGGKPMFTAVASNTAQTPQPITAAPALVRHPTGVGHLVIFATGKYFEDTDKDGNKNIAQTVYGIWDEKSRGEKLGTTSALGITRAKLVEQTISSQVTATDSNARNTAARIISQNAIPWGDGKKGWLLELKQGGTLDGEMVIEPMITIGQSVYFQSLVPNDDPCADGASNWTYGLNAFTGGKTPYNAFDMQQVKPDGTTAIVSAIKQDGEGGLTVTDTPDGLQICTGQGCEGIKPPPNINARNSWRRIEETE